MSYLLIGIHTDKFNANKFIHFNDEVLDDSVKDYYHTPDGYLAQSVAMSKKRGIFA